MKLPPRPHADRLWRRLADAQDAALADEGASRAGVASPVDVALSARAASRGGRRRWRLAVFTTGFGLAVAAVALIVRGFLGAGPAGPGPDVGGADRTFVTDARTELPLRFADGSVVVFRVGTTARLRHPTATGADIVLERGSLDAHVVHAETTLWLVHAGPYRVRVTGTRFAMAWVGANLDVSLFEGSVVIDGALLGAGVPLRAGQRLKISSGVVLIEALPGPATAPAAADPRATGGAGSGSRSAPSSSPASPPAEGGEPMLAPGPTAGVTAAGSFPASAAARSPRRGGQRAGANSDDEWMALAERGAYGEALAVARRLGWADLCRRLDSHRLLTLGDVARYSGARQQARRAFESLVSRFPEDRLAADAVFSLGRLAFESRRPDEATRWFRRYVGDWPDGPLADQAAGRLVESAIRMDDRDAARSAARAYLARAPRGPQAALAREVLDQPLDGPP